MNTTSPNRDTLPDLLRAFALIGIVLVNVEMFSSGLNGYPEISKKAPEAQSLIAVVFGLFTMKSYSLFSMMFGAGLGYQLASARRVAGQSDPEGLFTRRYFRRMLGLGILGLLHAIFFFSGDILVTYAILGCVLYLFRNSNPRHMFWWGLLLIVIQALVLFGLSGLMFALESLPPGELRDEIFNAMEQETAVLVAVDDVFRTGSFIDAAIARAQIYLTVLQSIPMVQGVSALGFFLLGLSCFSQNWLNTPDLPLWKWSRLVLLPLGLAISLPAGWAYSAAAAPDSGLGLLALGFNVLASVPFTLGIIGWFAMLGRAGNNPILKFIALGGSASLTAYLLQSLVLSFVFTSYGLGLFGKLPVSTILLIALATGVGSVIIAAGFRSVLRRGPAEILLRRWTYFGETPKPNAQ